MGAFQGVAQGIGRIGNEYATAHDKNIEDALKSIHDRLMISSIQGQIAEQQQRIKLNAAPQPVGVLSTPGGGESYGNRDPFSGKVTTQPLSPGVDPQKVAAGITSLGSSLPKEFQPLFQAYAASALQPGQDPNKVAAEAQKTFESIQSKLTTKDTTKGTEFDEWREQFKSRTGRYPNDQEINTWHRQPKAGTDTSSSPADIDKDARAIANGDLLPPKTISKKDASWWETRMARAKELGWAGRSDITPALRDKLTDKLTATDNAIRLIDSITSNMDLLGTLQGASLARLAESPGTISRIAGYFTSDDKKSRIEQLAADAKSLQEAINTIRGPLGATGFRGKEGWEALQRQALDIMAAPGVNTKVLANTKQLLTKLRETTNQTLQGGPKDSAPQQQDATPGTIRARDPQGKLHEAKAGTPLPAGWKLE